MEVNPVESGDRGVEHGARTGNSVTLSSGGQVTSGKKIEMKEKDRIER